MPRSVTPTAQRPSPQIVALVAAHVMATRPSASETAPMLLAFFKERKAGRMPPLPPIKGGASALLASASSDRMPEYADRLLTLLARDAVLERPADVLDYFIRQLQRLVTAPQVKLSIDAAVGEVRALVDAQSMPVPPAVEAADDKDDEEGEGDADGDGPGAKLSRPRFICRVGVEAKDHF